MNKTIFLPLICLSIVNSLAKAQSIDLRNRDIVAAEIDFVGAAENYGLKYAFEKNLDSLGLIVNCLLQRIRLFQHCL